jgi:rare lipoprotein A
MAFSVLPLRRPAGLFLTCAFALVLSACAGGRGPNPTVGSYKVGQPYQVAGTWYYPREDADYNETGVASWYGSQFQGRQTANGERFDMNLMTAAHPTLPLPSHVRVTNLNNGRSVIVRVNDRGPFARGRIIDMSRAAARELGFERDGTAPVRVQNLGVAPLNVASEEARGVLEGRRMQLASVSASTVTATTLTPPGTATSRPVATAPAQDVNGPGPSERNRLPETAPRLYVQVGAFGMESNALNLLSRLRASGQVPNAGVAQAWIDGQQLYRVRVGPYTDVNDADAALRQVAGLGYTAARIIVD